MQLYIFSRKKYSRTGCAWPCNLTMCTDYFNIRDTSWVLGESNPKYHSMYNSQLNDACRRWAVYLDQESNPEHFHEVHKKVVSRTTMSLWIHYQGNTIILKEYLRVYPILRLLIQLNLFLHTAYSCDWVYISILYTHALYVRVHAISPCVLIISILDKNRIWRRKRKLISHVEAYYELSCAYY